MGNQFMSGCLSITTGSMMLAAYLLIFLPSVILSKKNAPVIVPETDLKVCEYFDARIVRLREMVQDLRQDVDIGSDLYKTLEESKLCDTVGYVAIPECAAKNEGDECAAKKTQELIKKPLRHAIKAEKIKEMPSGEKFFAYCKHIGYKNVLTTFKRSRSLMSAECGLPGQEVGNRKKRNTELLPALLLAGSYDPSSIWFQYFLCKDIDLYCYFFTQGWTQGQYGQYYLYDNLFDDNTGLFAGSSDSSNLATIALLGGLGGGYSHPTGYYPTYGPQAPTQRKRRGVGFVGEECVGDDCNDEMEGDRRKRDVCPDGTDDCSDRNQRDLCDGDNLDDPDCMRKRRDAADCVKYPNHEDCPERKRRDAVDCVKYPNHEDCPKRKRRDAVDSANEKCTNNDANCGKRRQACEACKKN